MITDTLELSVAACTADLEFGARSIGVNSETTGPVGAGEHVAHQRVVEPDQPEAAPGEDLDVGGIAGIGVDVLAGVGPVAEQVDGRR